MRTTRSALVGIAALLPLSCDWSTQSPGDSGRIRLVNTLSGYGTALLAFQPGTRSLGIATFGRVVILDADHAQEWLTYPLPVRSKDVTGRAIAWSGDGRLFAASLNNGLIVVDALNRSLLLNEAMPQPFDAIDALAFTPTGKELILGGQMPAVYVLDLETREIVRTLAPVESTAGVAVLPDDSTLAICDFTKGVELWSIYSGRRLSDLAGCNSYRSRLALAGEYLLAACGAHAVQVWDVNSRRDLGTIEGYTYIAQQFSASAEGGMLLAGTEADTRGTRTEPRASRLLLLDIADHRTLKVWPAHSVAGVYATAITTDGKWLASCGYDGLLKLWEWETTLSDTMRQPEAHSSTEPLRR